MSMTPLFARAVAASSVPKSVTVVPAPIVSGRSAARSRTIDRDAVETGEARPEASDRADRRGGGKLQQVAADAANDSTGEYRPRSTISRLPPPLKVTAVPPLPLIVPALVSVLPAYNDTPMPAVPVPWIVPVLTTVEAPSVP